MLWKAETTIEGKIKLPEEVLVESYKCSVMIVVCSPE
jgi:hypothetical protein